MNHEAAPVGALRARGSAKDKNRGSDEDRPSVPPASRVVQSSDWLKD